MGGFGVPAFLVGTLSTSVGGISGHPWVFSEAQGDLSSTNLHGSWAESLQVMDKFSVCILKNNNTSVEN